MWHTNNGDRTLEGAEAKLFAYTLWDFLCELEVEGGDFDAGLKAFDCLTYGQKLSVLSAVANGLLKPDVPIRKLTAAVESALQRCSSISRYWSFWKSMSRRFPAVGGR